MMSVADILLLHPYPPGFLETLNEWRDHYLPCSDCSHERDSKHRLRLCGEGRRLWYAVLETLPPGQDRVLSAVVDQDGISPPAQRASAHSPHEED